MEQTPLTTTTNNNNSPHVKQWETRASEIVLVIQKCMESLRNVKEFASLSPAALWTAVKPSKNAAPSLDNQNKNIHSIIATTDLYSKLVEDGILAEVDSCYQFQNGNGEYMPSENSESRTKLTYEVLLPLTKALSECYDYLDQVPPPAKAPEPLSQRKFKAKQQQPPPPAGMLSLQNYTDVGAFAEFLVCTSILPFLEPCILFSVEDRARYFLPKSLAGRISKPSLLWGCRQKKTLGKTATGEQLREAVQELHATVVALGHLLLLDRFRPMLLPRHLADLYAAIFQSEAYDMIIRQLSKTTGTVDKTSSSAEAEDLTREFNDIVALLLPNDTESGAFKPHNEQQSLVPVDPGLQVQALQTLLLQGTKSPLWLRRRVSKQLTDMACHNLSVIVQVFVHAAPPKDKAAASARLAHTLVSPSQKQAGKSVPDNEQAVFYDLLCRQLINLLDNSVDESLRQNSDVKHGELTSKQTLDIHTVWNIMDQLPLKEMHHRMLVFLSEGMLDNAASESGRTTIHRSVKRIGALLSSVPPSLNPSKISQLFLLPLRETGLSGSNTAQLEGTKSTMLGVFVRLASMTPSVLKSDFHDDAVWATRMLLHVLLESRFVFDLGGGEDEDAAKSEDGTRDRALSRTADPVEVVAIALVYSIAPTNWDLSGYTYVLGANSTTAPPTAHSKLDCIGIKRQEDPVKNAQDLVSIIEKRVEFVLKELIDPLVRHNAIQEGNESEDGIEPTKHNGDNLPSSVFHLILLLYFTAITSQQQSSSNLPAVFRQSGSEFVDHFFRVIAMCMLPLLCERFQPESLLMGSYDGGSGILKMMQLVFTCAASYFASEKVMMDSFTDKESMRFLKSGTDSCSHECFRESGSFLSRVLGGVSDKLDSSQVNVTAQEARNQGPVRIDSDSSEMLLSVTSLLLSLLIAILELGTTRRSGSEEEILGSFPLLLRPLAEVSDMPWIRERDDENHESAQPFSASCAEIAEMAAHAMALLAAREAPRVGQTDNDIHSGITKKQRNTEDIIMQTLQEAERDLKSTQPPIRARGVVSLQRMLRGPLLDTLLPQRAATSTNKKLIVEIEETESPELLLVDKAIDGVLRVSVHALSDEESYVFLAAIQSIVAAADLFPSKVLPLVGEALASGLLNSHEREFGVKTALTPEQRVKLAEALMFCIRRRARIDEFISVLMDLMIFGDGRGADVGVDIQNDAKAVDLIQKETRDYFLIREATYSDDLNDVEEDFEEKAEKQNLRYNTGGPLFRSEEADVVTAARITVVSELLTAANPTVVSKYCSVVVRIATESLRLDASRPVRRAAASLAREIYRSLLREHVDMLEAIAGTTGADSEFSPDLALATALVLPQNNDEILASALRRCVSADDLGDVSKSKYRVFDAATAARCQEALDARQEVVDGGLLAVARVIAETKELHDSRPVNRVIRDLLDKGAHDTVKAMQGLKLDVENLALN